MKPRILIGSFCTMVWAATAVASGFGGNGLDPQATAISSGATATTAPGQGMTAAARSSPPAPALPDKEGNQLQSPTTRLSSWSHEIQRLTQAGVDEQVILSYITNSAGIFSLSPDHIICLRNAGVSSQVINSMIHHDQQLIPSAQPLTATGMPLTKPTAGSPASGASQAVVNDQSSAQDILVSEGVFSAPEQPESAGPVRLPYTVKLNDPIIIWRLPSFAVPCW